MLRKVGSNEDQLPFTRRFEKANKKKNPYNSQGNERLRNI